METSGIGAIPSEDEASVYGWHGRRSDPGKHSIIQGRRLACPAEWRNPNCKVARLL